MAVYQALLLNTVVPQIQAAQAGDSYVMVVNATTPALRITQTGTGDSILVEDAANPDSSPFVVTSAGDVGIGTSSPGAKLDVAGAAPTIKITANNATQASLQLTQTGVGNWLKYFRVSDSAFVEQFGGTDLLFLSTAGNLGLGVTPKAWQSAPALEGTSFAINPLLGADQTGFSTGCYQDVYGLDTGWKSKGAYRPTLYAQTGSHIFFVSTAVPTGANQAVTFTQAMTLDASGNLLVGTTTSSNRTITVGAASASIALADANGGIYFGATGTPVGSGGFGVNAAIARAGGTNFHIAGSAVGDLCIAPEGTKAILFGTSASASSVTERARITSGGYFKASDTGTYASSTGTFHEFYQTANNNGLQVTCSATTGTLYGPLIYFSGQAPNDATSYFLQCSDTGGERATIRSNGGLANYSANNVNLASDERLKKDISPLGSTWGKVKAIEVVNFRYKDCNEGDPALFGVIAQQVQPIVPELVVVTQQAKDAVEAKDAVLDADGNVVEPAIAAKEATPEYYGIREQPMYWLAIKALQEAMARIETLEAEVAALKGA